MFIFQPYPGFVFPALTQDDIRILNGEEISGLNSQRDTKGMWDTAGTMAWKKVKRRNAQWSSYVRIQKFLTPLAE